jgi:DsbC/DsbD-like thiol-disulfide interchange protein/cytochrome c biogenesis protein CcdA
MNCMEPFPRPHRDRQHSHARDFPFFIYIGRALRSFRLLVALAILALPAHAQTPGAPQNVRASIEAETETPAPGDTVTVAIIMDPKPGWHDYWLNPGDAGTPLELEWQLPPGVTAGPIRAPVPETLIVSGFMNHIYKTKHAFLVDLKIASNVRAGQKLDIKVDARWSACSDTVCVPEGGVLFIPLITGSGEIAERSRFDTWRAALPVPLDQQARYAIDRKRIDIAIPYPESAGVEKVWFFPRTENVFRYAAPQNARRTGDWLVVSGEVSGAFDGRIDGLLRLGDAQGLEVRAMPGAVPPGGSTVSILGQSAAAAMPESTVNFGWILGFSILGGLLLNLMPCVFPILGLKALSLAKLGSDEREARREALAYSAGVILSCIALGGLLLALRAGGEEIGWAFQLQEPALVLLLLLLMVAVTANLAGLFEMGSINGGGSLTRQSGMAGSFWTGVLAAVVATPCTGPFMAAALGAALLLPVVQALLLFAGLGFGLALPFLLLAYVPAARRMLPKPGPWLNNFRKAMAVPMGLTALALLWLLWRLTGEPGLLVGGITSLIIILRLAWYGKTQSAGGSWRVTAGTIAIAAAFAFLILPKDAPVKSGEHDLLASQVFSEERLAGLREQGSPVFAYFTADWCVTCKVNEVAAVNREETKAAFGKAGIVTLKGDFTRRDPAISRFLAQHGRSGVPLYLYYPAGGEPVVLPQILTVDMLTELAR